MLESSSEPQQVEEQEPEPVVMDQRPTLEAVEAEMGRQPGGEGTVVEQPSVEESEADVAAAELLARLADAHLELA